MHSQTKALIDGACVVFLFTVRASLAKGLSKIEKIPKDVLHGFTIKNDNSGDPKPGRTALHRHDHWPNTIQCLGSDDIMSLGIKFSATEGLVTGS